MAHWETSVQLSDIPLISSNENVSICASDGDDSEDLDEYVARATANFTTEPTAGVDIVARLPLEVLAIITANLCNHEDGIITEHFFKFRLVSKAWASVGAILFVSLAKKPAYRHYSVLHLPPRSPHRLMDIIHTSGNADPQFKSAFQEVKWHILPSWRFRSDKDALKYVENGLTGPFLPGVQEPSAEQIREIAVHLQMNFQSRVVEQETLVKDIMHSDDQQNGMSRLMSTLPDVTTLSIETFDYWMRVSEEMKILRERLNGAMFWNPISKYLHSTDSVGDPYRNRAWKTCLETIRSLSPHHLTFLNLIGITSYFLRLLPAAEAKITKSPNFTLFMSNLSALSLSISRRDILQRRWIMRCDWKHTVEPEDCTNAGRFHALLARATRLRYLSIQLEHIDYIENMKLAWHEWLAIVLSGQHWENLETFKCAGFGITDHDLLALFRRHTPTLRDVSLTNFILDLPDAQQTEEDAGNPVQWVSRLIVGLRDELSLQHVTLQPRKNGLKLLKSCDERLRRLGKELSVVMAELPRARQRNNAYADGIHAWILKQWEPSDERLRAYEDDLRREEGRGSRGAQAAG